MADFKIIILISLVCSCSFKKVPRQASSVIPNQIQFQLPTVAPVIPPLCVCL